MSSAAADTFATLAPQKQTTHEARTPWGEIIFTSLVAVITFLIFCWLSLVFVFYQAGYRHPGEEAAQVLLTIGTGALIILAVVFIALKLLGPLFGGISDLGHAHIEARVKVAEIRYRAAQQLPAETAHRMTSEGQRKHRTIMAVMERGFNSVDTEGRLKGSVQPWARRQVGTLQLVNETTQIGANTQLASWVKSYLTDKGILLTDRLINIKEFPTLKEVQAAIQGDFGDLIIVK